VYFNPFQKPKISIDGTTIPNIINNYWKFLKEVIEPVSFRRSTGKDSYRQCFGKYHSGGHIELSNSYIITNFLTHYPQNNLGIISQYNSNNTKCFDLSANLVIPKDGTWKALTPQYNNLDFRETYFNKEIYLKNALLSLIFNNKFKEFDICADGCTIDLSRPDDITYEDHLVFDFQNEIQQDENNLIFIESSEHSSKVELNNHLINILGLGDTCKITFEEIHPKLDSMECLDTD